MRYYPQETSIYTKNFKHFLSEQKKYHAFHLGQTPNPNLDLEFVWTKGLDNWYLLSPRCPVRFKRSVIAIWT